MGSPQAAAQPGTFSKGKELAIAPAATLNMLCYVQLLPELLKHEQCSNSCASDTILQARMGDWHPCDLICMDSSFPDRGLAAAQTGLLRDGAGHAMQKSGRIVNMFAWCIQGKASSKRAKGKAQAQVQTPGFDAWLDQTGSDPTLTMMHALGKFLYNKRLAPESASIVVSQPSGWFGAATTMQRRAEQSQPTQPSASQPARSQPASYSQEQASTTGLTHAQQPLGSQPFSRQPGISSCEPASTDRINVQQPPRSQPSQQSRESSKLDPGAEAGGAVSSSWPEDDGVAMADDDLVDLTMDDPLSQGQSQQQQAASQTGTLVVIEPAPELASLPMAAR